jgi:predicted nucleotidyltransferase
MVMGGTNRWTANKAPALQPGTFGSYALFRSNLKSHSDADVATSKADLANVPSRLVNRHPASQIDQLMPWVYTPTNRVA